MGDARAAVLSAVQDISFLQCTQLVRRSSLYGSAPVEAAGADYVNAVVQVLTHLTAPQLLAQLQATEDKAGRQRPYRNAPRTLDLDILLYGQARIDSAALTVPHPRMWERAFVLLPLAELEPDAVDIAYLAAVGHQRVWRLD